MGSLISSEIAEPYAQALMSVAKDNNLTEEFGRDFRALDNLLEESQELSDFILNPVIQDEDKKGVLRNVMGDQANPLLVNFLMLLVDKRRIFFLGEVVSQYLELLRQLNQVVLADVTTAQDLSESQRQELEAKVKSMTQAQGVELKTTVDPSILGGVIIRVGSQVLDASLQGQLRRIGMSLDA